MKKVTLLLMVSMLLVTFSSCKKEGVYNPKEKISRIYKDYGDGKVLKEVWNWDKKTLERIDHYSGGSVSWSEEFTYNKKGQIERVDCYEDGETTEYTYDGRKLSKITYYYNGSIEEEYSFKHDGNKISEIEIMYFYRGKRESRLMTEGYNPIKMLLPEESYKAVRKTLNDNATRGDVTTVKLEWEKNNISKIEARSGSEEVVWNCTYDDKLNPFKNFWSLYPDDNLETNMALSKNNVTEIRYTEREDGETYSDIEKYTYSYDGKFPTVKRYTYSYEEYDYYEDKYYTVTVTTSTYYEYE